MHITASNYFFLFSVLSLPVFSQTVIAQEIVWVSDFSVPLEEEWKSKNKHPEAVYTISGDSTEAQFLAAYAEQDDNFLIKKIEIDLVKFPYLNWSWRAQVLPAQGDESIKATCDVTACVNVVLKASKWKPRTIKYSWSTTLAEGTRTESPFAYWPSRCDIVVMESGYENQGSWVNEKVNVLEDYKKFYKKKKVNSLVIEAFVIMTDSDNTASVSAADYANIFFSAQ